MRIGVFGGTFDPPHLGHMILASEAKYQLSIDRLLWVITEIPPHKLDSKITVLEDRLELVKAALEDNVDFQLSRIEIDRPGPHFAVDTIRLLHDQFPEDEIIYIMGGDSLSDLPSWHNAVEFVRQVDGIGVLQRPGESNDLPALEKILPGVTEKTVLLETPLIEISSTLIRKRIREGKPFRYFVLPKVHDLILQKKLYH